MVRIAMEVKNEIVEKYEGGMSIRDLAAAYRMPRTVSTIVKTKTLLNLLTLRRG
jgi:Mor family transcriptional regulator